MERSLTGHLLEVRANLTCDGSDPFFERYGLLGNPFPTTNKIFPEILHQHDYAFERLVDLSACVLAPRPERRALGILGEPGVGKTHFLRHAQYQLKEACNRFNVGFVMVEYRAGSAHSLGLVRQTLEAADAACRSKESSDLLSAIVAKLRLDHGRRDILRSVRMDELRIALERLVQTAGSFGDENGAQPGECYNALFDVTSRWLKAHVVSQSEIRWIGAFSSLVTASLAVRRMSEMLRLARRLDVIHGLVLCLDELETLFTQSMRQDRVQAMLQDIKYLHEEAVKDDGGYSLLILSASTSEGTRRLAEMNYPMFELLGFRARDRVELEPICTFEEAEGFADTYLKYGHRSWKHAYPGQPHDVSARNLLSKADIKQACDSVEKLLADSDDGKTARTIRQAVLLDALHERVEHKRRQEAES